MKNLPFIRKQLNKVIKTKINFYKQNFNYDLIVTIDIVSLQLYIYL